MAFGRVVVITVSPHQKCTNDVKMTEEMKMLLKYKRLKHKSDYFEISYCHVWLAPGMSEIGFLTHPVQLK